MYQKQTPSGLKLQPLTEATVPVLLGLIRELAEYEKLLDQVTATAETLKESCLGNRPAAEVLLAFLDREPAGYCVFFQSFSTFLGQGQMYVEDVYVRPRFRRLGLGRAIFGHLAGLARDRGCQRLDFAVLEWNAPAIRFYESLGAGPLGDWRMYRFEGPALARLAQGA